MLTAAIAQSEFDRNIITWLVPFVAELDARESGLSLEWIIRCVVRILPLSETEDLESHLANIVELRELRKRGLPLEELRNRAREIWHEKPIRDIGRTAVSKLFEAAAVLTAGKPSYQMRANMPLNAMLCESKNQMAIFEIIAQEHETLATQFPPIL